MFIRISSGDAILGVNTFEDISWAQVWTIVDGAIFLELTKLKHSTWTAASVIRSTLNLEVMRSVNEELKQIIGEF